MTANFPVDADTASGTVLAIPDSVLAEQLGCSRRTLSRMRTEGTGPPYVRVHGQRIAYRIAAVEEWMRQTERAQTNSDGV